MTGFAALALAMSISPGLRTPDLPVPPVEALIGPPPPAALDAQAWMLYSIDAEAELWSQNADQQRAPASVTKVMTALLVLEQGDLRALEVISTTADATPIGFPGQPEVVAGEQWNIGDLLDLLIVKSANDVAAALAEHVAGSEEAFVELMNERAGELGMSSTTFMNPHGLDAPGHLSTARDLIAMGRAAVEHPRLVASSRILYFTLQPPGRALMELENTNKLIGSFPGVYGLKTGDTAAAGLVLLSYLDAGWGRFLGVVMGSQDHLAATRELLAYGLETLGPADYLLAPIAGTELAATLPDWLAPRLAGAGRLGDGTQSLTPTRGTPGGLAILGAYRDLLPELLGGDP
jgi:D-alanyl-D-alanine carboxypeptidase (penicillin-binding protein 5/6)